MGLALHAFRLAFVILLLAALASQTTLANGPQNDAGLGTDAGNTRDAATPLPGYGAYGGELRSQDDDWYTTTRAASPACILLTVTGDTYADATLAVKTGDATYGVRAPISNGSATRLAVAGSAVTQTWEGFVRVPNPVGNDPARPRIYNFTLERAATPTGDGGMPGDAGSSLMTARSLAAGCSGGSLRPLLGLGDTRDVYSFTLAEPGDIVYSLGATAPVRLHLVDEQGATVGPAIGTDQIALATLPAGTFYLSLATPMAEEDVVTYVLGLVGPDPPPGRPCRPHCIVTE